MSKKETDPKVLNFEDGLVALMGATPEQARAIAEGTVKARLEAIDQGPQGQVIDDPTDDGTL